MDPRTYKVIKRRTHVARQRAQASQDPTLWREYERAKAQLDRAYAERARYGK